LRIKASRILLLTLISFALRLACLGRQSLWYDEAFSLAVARAEPSVFWAALLSDGVHPPGYYLLLREGVAAFGASEFALRFLSAVAGTLAVPLMWRLGRALGNDRWGLAAGLLLALNPFALWYAQEARMYSLLLCLTIATGYAFWKLVTQPTPARWLGLAFISALSFAVHYFALISSLAQFVYLVANLRQTHRSLRWWVSAQAVAFLTFLPWAVAIATREGRNFGIGWIHAPTLLDLPLTLSNLALALSDPASPWTWGGLLFVIVGIGIGVVSLTKPNPTSNFQFPTSNLQSPISFLLLWLLFPLAFAWLISLRLPLYVDRFFIICLPPLLLLLSSTISLSSARLARSTMTVLVVVSTLACLRLWLDPHFIKEDWRAAASYVQAAEKAGDALVMRDFQTGIPFGYYYRGELKAQAAAINQQIRPLDELAGGAGRLWLVYRRPFEATHELAASRPFRWQDDQEPAMHAWLVSHQEALAREETFPGVYVVLYQLPPRE
jgi:mannosyltransferase